jgi:hypothetical protein
MMKMKISAVKPHEIKLFRDSKPMKVIGSVVIKLNEFDLSEPDFNIKSKVEMKKLLSDLRKAALKAGWGDL